MPNESPEPLFRVLKGAPTEAELAALAVVLLSLSGEPAAALAPVIPLAAWRRHPYEPPVSWRRAA
ncbi:acyl-CoA carboxylase subunit epsilon [Streptomyces sp. NBC_00083]|uniref:acyl-CoA carboxylase subunit epsilon n=1 Tax=Streptomyces sp. NBC_00083 TaxID=2975647 RepID=UPI0022540DC8|nr:acyl-CoA carboxylase subunit epsilon [Streptomyces sp. NBC_00083]MCX5382493.1 acyl-CoA carboxylase subunit epsilon [Streptomyces sp. NBC_00083]